MASSPRARRAPLLIAACLVALGAPAAAFFGWRAFTATPELSLPRTAAASAPRPEAASSARSTSTPAPDDHAPAPALVVPSAPQPAPTEAPAIAAPVTADPPEGDAARVGAAAAADDATRQVSSLAPADGVEPAPSDPASRAVQRGPAEAARPEPPAEAARVEPPAEAARVEPPAEAARPEPDTAEPRRVSRAEVPPVDPAAEEARLRAALDTDPEDDDARVSLAVLVGARGEQDEADALLATLGEDESGRLRRVEALVRLGRSADARAALDALSESVRARPRARMSAARLALAADHPDEAVRELAPLARSQDASAPLLALYARALLATGRVAAANEAYAASIERDATLPEALIGRARMAVRSRRPTDAMRILDRIDVRALRPELATRVQFLRGRAQLMAEERAAARRTLRRVVQRPGAPTQAYFFLGEAYAGHNYQSARAAYERYLELEPDGYYAARARRALGLDR